MLSIHSLEKYTLTMFPQTIDISMKLYVELTTSKFRGDTKEFTWKFRDVLPVRKGGRDEGEKAKELDEIHFCSIKPLAASY